MKEGEEVEAINVGRAKRDLKQVVGRNIGRKKYMEKSLNWKGERKEWRNRKTCRVKKGQREELHSEKGTKQKRQREKEKAKDLH